MINYELKHYGVKGMRWGVRRYQNEDGTPTNEGAKRYPESFKERTLYRRLAKRDAARTYNYKRPDYAIDKFLFGARHERKVADRMNKSETYKKVYNERLKTEGRRRFTKAAVVLGVSAAVYAINAIGADKLAKNVAFKRKVNSGERIYTTFADSSITALALKS